MKLLNPIPSRRRIATSLPSTLRLVVATAITVATIAVGATVAVTAGATNTNTTYYACLTSGSLSSVGTSTPKCKSPGTVITWNQTGPAGAAGNTVLNGKGAPSTTIGNVGDFYLETSNHTIFGPATRTCSPLPCHTIWGTGTSLVGPKGQGNVFDTTTSGVPDPNGQSERVLTQTLAGEGDYLVIGELDGSTQSDLSNSSWSCDLVAANPGGTTVVLDSEVQTGNGEPSEIHLQGVVSLAAGGVVGINCGEDAAKSINDELFNVHIDSTLVSSFTPVAPG